MIGSANQINQNHVKGNRKMDGQKDKKNEEMDCHVTVNDGSYMTCDMIDEDPSDEEEMSQDYAI